jgi:phosphate transport system substrate-binding protein
MMRKPDSNRRRAGLTAACGGGSSGPVKASAEATSGANAQINGAGATFPNPIYSKWFSEYNKIHPN